MTTIEQIEAAILTLNTDDFHKLRTWFLDLDHQQSDKQLQQDIIEGRLDALGEEAISDFNAGNFQKI